MEGQGGDLVYVLDPIQAHRAAAMQNVFEFVVVDAHAARGEIERQAFAYDQAHGRPIQCALAAFVVTHVDTFDVRFFRFESREIERRAKPQKIPTKLRTTIEGTS